MGQVSAGGDAKIKAAIKAVDGQNHGVADFYKVPGGSSVDAQLKELPPGERAFHVHSKGSCSPDLKAVGSYLNSKGVEHGLGVGKYAGTHPNIHAPDNGFLRIEILNTKVSLDSGSKNDFPNVSTIIYANGGDYQSQPSKANGPRIAGVVIGTQFRQRSGGYLNFCNSNLLITTNCFGLSKEC